MEKNINKNIIDLSSGWVLCDFQNKEISNNINLPFSLTEILQNQSLVPDINNLFNQDPILEVLNQEYYFENTFEFNSIFQNKEIILNLNFLDTLSTLFINEIEVQSFENAFIENKINISKYLVEGQNIIKIKFIPVTEEIKKKESERYFRIFGSGRIEGAQYIRKPAYSFGWDFAPVIPDMGLYSSFITISEKIKLNKVKININPQNKNDLLLWEIITEIELPSIKKHLSLEIILKDGETEVFKDSIRVRKNLQKIKNIINNPKLWWTHDLGDQNLYTLCLNLKQSETIIDSVEKTIAFCKINLDQSELNNSKLFRFSLNNKEIFIKGGNIVPPNLLLNRKYIENYKNVIQNAKDLNINLVRIWGGGRFEPTEVYEMFLKQGLLVWQDFMFACGAYDFESEKGINILSNEIDNNIERLHHFKNIAIWCGNNELEKHWVKVIGDDKSKGQISFENYSNFFDGKIPSILFSYLNKYNYIPSSSYNSLGNRQEADSDSSGTSHLWDLWFSDVEYDWFKKYLPQFVAEFGFQSFSSLETIKKYWESNDKEAENYYQKSYIGNGKILDMVKKFFVIDLAEPETIYLYSQITQGYLLSKAIKYFRLNKITNGTIIWQLNDAWPGITWSITDYSSKLKASGEFIKNAFAQKILNIDIFGNILNLETNFEINLKDNLLMVVDLVKADGSAQRLEEILNKNQRLFKLNEEFSLIKASIRKDNTEICNDILILSPQKDLKLIVS